jgi:hypothetical protein
MHVKVQDHNQFFLFCGFHELTIEIIPFSQHHAFIHTTFNMKLVLHTCTMLTCGEIMVPIPEIYLAISLPMLAF